ncbi:MAG: hypothetical protein AABZ74_09140 [Cyanobacteriota bacterium]
MKKIIITILVGLFSCQTTVVNKDKDKNMTNTTTTKIEPKDNTKPDLDCKPYNTLVNSQERFYPYGVSIYDYLEKILIKKEKPYLEKIKIGIYTSINYLKDKEYLEINNDNNLKIKEIESYYDKYDQNRNDPGYGSNYILINKKDVFYINKFSLELIFNTNCEYNFLKTKTVFSEEIINDNGIFSGSIDLSKEKIEIDKIESILHEYNKYFIHDIKEIEFSSTSTLKIFLLFIRLSIQEPVFYKDLKIPIQEKT